MSNVALLFPGQGSQMVGMGRDFGITSMWLRSYLKKQVMPFLSI